MKTLKINKEIFSDETIINALNEYKFLAKIKMTPIQNYVLLTFSDCKYEEDLTINEFQNYLIGVENSKC